VVLRDGRKVADEPSSGLTADRLAEMITGRRAGTTGTASPPSSSAGSPALLVRGLAGGALRRLDLQVCPGEVLGVAGNLGSGREHVAGLLFGSTRRAAGTVAISGGVLRRGTPYEALRHGLALVPADRAAHGGVPSLSVRENLTLPRLRPLSFARVHLRRGRERADAHRWTRRVGLHPALPDRPLGQFSGGNQQKAVLARWLRTAPTVLLVEEPTQGVDVGASEAIRELIAEAARQGTAVLVASSDNADLVRLCNRVLVLRDGEPVAHLSGEEITDHRLTQESLGRSAADLIAAAHLESTDA
jgi:ABC-type sugar transport system ATPase subunit